MGDCDGSQQTEKRGESTGERESQDTKIKQEAPSRYDTRTATYIPSPPPGNSPEITNYMASLTLEQREMVSEFIQATKEPVSIAVQALQDSEWDLLDAVSRFGEDVEQENEDDLDSSTPAITPIRSRNGPVPPPRSRAIDKPHLYLQALFNTTKNNGKDYPKSLRAIFFEPISLSHSPVTDDTPSAPMFASPGDEKMWYTGFMRPFEKQAVLATVAALNLLLSTESFQTWTRTRQCLMGNAEEEDIAHEDCVWAPRFVIKFRNFGENSETRLIGHIEFLAGRPGALSEAYRLRKTAKWGSLRCVLGDISQWMLMNNHRYSFLASSDEIMFLRMDVKTIKVKDRERSLVPKAVLCEPWLHYSEPMKISDAFDAKEKKITTRMGIFHLFWLALQSDYTWRLPDEIGNCLEYAMFTGDQENLKQRPPQIPESSPRKKARKSI
ncbi:hypothetical protein OPT61_g9736 [Boeremia exigua]|uniref:Uncharacterized protein n=1 Tax=Boeremia exigua TaxID=749465 RepID=A0ACC2HTU5_9PLEO|nr:hypothetical protein OPT61_g9736 [Boeremia exigua]